MASRARGPEAEFVPARYQPALPLDRLIRAEGGAGAGDRVDLDVLIVGAGPAGCARALELAQLARRAGNVASIGLHGEAADLGGQSASGAVGHPSAVSMRIPD